MNDILKWIGKFTLQLIVWTFILSINWNQKPLFTHAHEVFVQNALVEAVDEELSHLWSRVKETAKVTFSSDQEDKEKSM